MKQRIVLALTMLVALGVLSGACRGTATSTPTAVPSSTAPAGSSATAASETPSPMTTIPVGGVDVAWQVVVKPTVPVVARVNGDEVTAEEYLAELRAQLYYITERYMVNWYDGESQQQLPIFQDQVVQQLAQLRLAEQIAKVENIVVTPAEVDAEVATVKEQVLSSGSYATWEEFLTKMGLDDEKFVSQNRAHLLYDKLVEAHGGPDTAEQVHAAHILVDTEETGKEVLAKLKEGQAFADLAKEYSTDTGSKEQGGDLGWFPQGAMVAEFDAAAFSMKVGGTSGLVQTEYGYHIIQVLGKEVRPLSGDMLQTVKEQRMQEWFKAEMTKANIETLVKFAEPTPEVTPTAAA